MAVSQDLPIQIGRMPRDDDELWWLIKAMWGVAIPRVQVCPEHVAPFKAVADAFFSREPNYAVWYASRGSGKSLSLAVLGLTKSLLWDSDTTILGGSMTQSQNVSTHMSDLLRFKRAPVYALRGGSIEKGVTATQITLATGKRIRPIPASQTTVRGPHPPLTLLDEVDEMEWKIYEASMGQAMEQLNTRGEVVEEYIVASSTWQNPDGVFTRVMEQARDKGLPIYTWCWRELLAPHGWMSQRFIDKKRQSVSAEMWRTEYDLNEPSGASRAFDLDKLARYFREDFPAPIEQRIEEDDAEWTWEEPEASGIYATGADWAKENDKTIYATVRVDVTPRRLVHLRRVNRQPYPKMIKGFDDIVKRYNSIARHDKTGLGNVVHDFSETLAGTAYGFNFTDRKKKSQMLLDYITSVEAGVYDLPRYPVQDATREQLALNEFYKAHRSTTTADVYGSHKWDAHLPDDVAAMALAHMAAENIILGGVDPVTKEEHDVRKADAQFHAKPFAGDTRTDGGVTIVDERYDDLTVMSLEI